MGGDGSGVIGITQRELLMEMRDEIRALRSVVDSVARDQALSVERRSAMQRVADTITGRLGSQPLVPWATLLGRRCPRRLLAWDAPSLVFSLLINVGRIGKRIDDTWVICHGPAHCRGQMRRES
jgi:hypothetical protein